MPLQSIKEIIAECAPQTTAEQIEALVAKTQTEGIALGALLIEVERRFLMRVLIQHRGNQCRAAVALGMHRNTLGRKVDELGISLDQCRKPMGAVSAEFSRQVRA